jgi:TatA/E family protein of Tat protein translocase
VLDLSPTKLLIIFIVMVVLLGPKRLPEVARQLGAGWRRLREVHGKFDRELRETMPDLPSSQDIVRLARSPITLLNQLADHSFERSEEPQGAPVTFDETGHPPDRATAEVLPIRRDALEPGGPAPASAERATSQVPLPSMAGLDADDPNLN